jgi:arylsulfatase A-like enzyme
MRLAERVRARALGRRVALAVAGVALLLTAGSLASSDVREAWTRARLADAATDGPNILLIILDTVRAASLSLYGHDRPTTPNLERFAREGVVYELAIAPSSWTLPAHASIFTGRDPNLLNADWWIPLDGTYPTLAEVLSDAGYATAGFSANLAYANRETGLARGFARFDDYTRTAGEALRTSVMLKRTARRLGLGRLLNDDWNGRRKADHVSGSFLDWLADVPEDRPFFAFLNYMDGHDPYHAPPPFDTLYAPRSPFLPLDWGSVPSEAVVRSWTDWYDRSITYLDAELGRLFEELRARGQLDNTIVVVTADHGEHLGEFGFMRHGSTLYMPVLHVPLIVRYPAAVPENVRVAAPVPTRDIAATVTALAGVPHDRIGGRSLAWTWSAQPAQPEAIYAEVREAIRVPTRYPNAAQDLQSIIAGGFQYIRGTERGEELFGLTPDTAVAIDPAASDTVRALLAEMRRDLELRAGEVVAGQRANRDPR